MQNSISPSNNLFVSNSYKPYITKTAFFLIILFLIAVLNNIKIINYSFTCLYDLGIQATTPIAKKLNEDSSLRHSLLITSSLLIDLTIISTMVLWIIKGKSWRFFFTGACFYGIRAMIQFTFMMPFPEFYSFDYPGFPSLMVSYSKTNDFFYSGHVGIPLICAYQYYKDRTYTVAFICILISIFQGIILLIHHAHYGVDIIIGMTCAHYFCIMTDKYIRYIDDSCISIDSESCNHKNKPLYCSYEVKVEGEKNEI